MKGLITNYLPYFILLYFLVRSIKKPAFLMGIPFLLFLRSSIFFNNLKVFLIPYSLADSPDSLLLFWLFVLWLAFLFITYVIKGKNPDRNLYEVGGFNWIDGAVMALLILSFIDFFSVTTRFFYTDKIGFEFTTLASLFIGYFIIKNFVRHINLNDLKAVFYSVVIVNSIGAFFYLIQQGFHITIYSAGNFSENLINGEMVTRNMYVMPVLSFFSIAYLLVFLKERLWINLCLLFLNFSALFFTFFRSFLLIGIVILLLYFLLISYKRKNYFAIFKNIILVLAGVAIFVFVIYKISPGSVTYLLGRFVELQQNPSDENSNDMIYRFGMMNNIIQRIPSGDRITGLGPVTEVQMPLVEDMKIATYDIVWPGVIFRWGFLGLALFVLIYLVGLKKSFSMFMNKSGPLSNWGTILFLTIIAQVLESFIIWGFMSPDRFAMGLWNFAILSALSNYKTVQHRVQTVIS